MSQIVTTTAPIILDRGFNKTPLVLELKDTLYAEDRLSDIRIVNSKTAPELICVFIEASRELVRAIGILEADLVEMSYDLENRHAYLLINEVPGILEAKRLKSSEDVREAVIQLDPMYSELKLKVNKLKQEKQRLNNRLHTIEKGYFSCQKIADVSSSASNRLTTNGFDVGTDENVTPGATIKNKYHGVY